MYRFITLLFTLTLFSSSALSKTLVIELVNGGILFFDSSEGEINTHDKNKLSKSDLRVFFILDVAKELNAKGVPWVSESEENISAILYNILNTFKYADYVYYKKYNTEDSELEDAPLEF
ncbi:MAG: hypothetical protein AB8G05_23250 [Oligoflexales bacterium]